MVTLISDNANPTRCDIDNYICKTVASGNQRELKKTIREIQTKQSVLHPSEQYFYDICIFQGFEGKK